MRRLFIWTTNHFASSYSIAALLSILADTDRPKVLTPVGLRPTGPRPIGLSPVTGVTLLGLWLVEKRPKHRRLIGLRLTGGRPPDKRQIDKRLEGSGLMYLRP